VSDTLASDNGGTGILIHDNGGTGILIQPTGSGAVRGALTRIEVYGNAFGAGPRLTRIHATDY
jgi:hypothetical protein